MIDRLRSIAALFSVCYEASCGYGHLYDRIAPLASHVDDIKRFARLRQVGCYFGLVPCLDSSAGKDRLGHITREGPATVRKLLCEAAWSCVRYNPRL